MKRILKNNFAHAHKYSSKQNKKSNQRGELMQQLKQPFSRTQRCISMEESISWSE